MDLNELILAQGYVRPSDDELRARLTKQQYNITQMQIMEPPNSSPYCDLFDPGIYVDITTGEPLFSSQDKFKTESGWPAFRKPIVAEVVTEHMLVGCGSVRIRLRSRAGNAHIGFLSKDAPVETQGSRYRIDGDALRFISLADLEAQGYDYLSELFAQLMLSHST